MKVITLAAIFCFLLALQSAFASEGMSPAGKEEGMALAEEILLREDLSEPLPAKEEKVNEKKLRQRAEESGEAPRMGDAQRGNAETAGIGEDAALKISAELEEGDTKEKAEPGTLAFEMDTVEMLADSPEAPDALPHEDIAKR